MLLRFPNSAGKGPWRLLWLKFLYTMWKYHSYISKWNTKYKVDQIV